MIRKLATAVALGLCLCSSLALAEDKKAEEPKLDGLKCMFCKMDVTKDVAVDYKGAKVYLGCGGCVAAFKEKVKKDDVIAAKANAQLVATKQAKQKGCPMSGQPIKDEHTIMVGKTKVGFCCPNCKKAGSELKGDKQLVALFGEKSFKKGFEVIKKSKAEPVEDVQ